MKIRRGKGALASGIRGRGAARHSVRQALLASMRMRLEREHGFAENGYRALDSHRQPAPVIREMNADHAFTLVPARILDAHLDDYRLEHPRASDDRLATEETHLRRIPFGVEMPAELHRRV